MLIRAIDTLEPKQLGRIVLAGEEVEVTHQYGVWACNEGLAVPVARQPKDRAEKRPKARAERR